MSLKTCHECDWIFSPFKDEEICNDCDPQIRPEVWCSWCEEYHGYDCGVETRKILANLVPCEICATPSAPTGTYQDSQGFIHDAAICTPCNIREGH